jgi:riboflavin kinase / FMN adenylyltransferase
MNVFKNTDELPLFKNAVLTIGTFDGVHTGHLQIINQLKKEASDIGGTPVLITFYPHPKQIIQGFDKPLFILNEQSEKFELLNKHGIENIVVVPFNKAFAALSADEYIQNFLVKKFHPKIIITGYDHRFGSNRTGDYLLLEEYASRYNYSLKEIPKHVLQNAGVSSTKIREALLRGDIDTAEKYLGYQYFFTGTVVQGNKLGRTIGYPTANLKIENEHKLIPANAVYAVDILYAGRKLKGMMNIGLRPTVNGNTRTIEVNIFNFDEDIYGEKLKIIIKRKLREEIKFSDLDALKLQLAQDKILAAEL